MQYCLIAECVRVMELVYVPFPTGYVNITEVL